jgi:hypothetical protein
MAVLYKQMSKYDVAVKYAERAIETMESLVDRTASEA